MNICKQYGFTLIELLIAIVIVAIISTIALPNYQEYMRKGRRADAKNAIMELAALQERYYSENGYYGSSTDIAGTSTISSPEDHYSIQVNCTPACSAASRPQQYLLTAIPAVADPKCGNFTYDQTGTVTEGGSSDLDYCW